MEKKNKIILVASLGIILVAAFSIFYLFSTNNVYLNLSTANNSGNYSGQNSGNNSNSNTPETSQKVLGSTDYGKVTVEGPYGNVNSPLKIAYIAGVHPLESNSHKAIIEAVKSDKSLNYCYYIYRVDVTKDSIDYDKGRMNGQLLANKFVVPDILSQNYKLTIDIHSNQGLADYSKVQRFVFAPLDSKNSKAFALEIADKVPGLVYFNPASQTSPQYVTIPIIKGGTPAIVYETYMYDPYGVTLDYAEKFVSAVDNMKI